MKYPEMNWKELWDEILYSLSDRYPDGELYGFQELGDGAYVLNKLYIGPDHVQYKMDDWSISKKTYGKFIKLVTTLKELEIE